MTITFYQQKRFDGGVRTGVDIDGVSAFHRFEAGGDDVDNALLWYLDVRCKGDELPLDSHGAIDWLRSNTATIQRLLESAVRDLEVGMDRELRPFRRTEEVGPPLATIGVYISCVQRMEAGEIAGEVQRIRDQWESILNSLEPMPVGT